MAFRLSPGAAARRRQRLGDRKRDKGKTASAGLAALCDWDVALTNVPPELLSGEEVVRLRRRRWQVELLFKQFKSVGTLSEGRGRRAARVESELLAKLLGQVVRGWQLLPSVGGVLRWSWCRCRRRLSRGRGALAKCLADEAGVMDWLGTWRERLLRNGRKKRQHRRPAGFQLTEPPRSLKHWVALLNPSGG